LAGAVGATHAGGGGPPTFTDTDGTEVIPTLTTDSSTSGDRCRGGVGAASAAAGFLTIRNPVEGATGGGLNPATTAGGTVTAEESKAVPRMKGRRAEAGGGATEAEGRAGCWIGGLTGAVRTTDSAAVVTGAGSATADSTPKSKRPSSSASLLVGALWMGEVNPEYLLWAGAGGSAGGRLSIAAVAEAAETRCSTPHWHLVRSPSSP
jgi:hypothetical protein